MCNRGCACLDIIPLRIWILKVRFDQPEPEGIGELDFSKAVPNTIECIDHVEAAVHHPEFLAHSLDVAINGSFVDMDIIAIGGIHQCVATFYYSRAAREQLQKKKLGNRQRDRFAHPRTSVPLGIHV